ncbi:MAG: hypothetical protein KGI98_11265 [Euryarchaeota archaeon]|nr:hypothetical protein [Euryarchaeota archaeon]MDE1880056.1 hypothetical protein [Euryarchaeota archaeon]MDE2045740.1 hypothetical protein [Thermoplasmata archaeon]
MVRSLVGPRGLALVLGFLLVASSTAAWWDTTAAPSTPPNRPGPRALESVHRMLEQTVPPGEELPPSWGMSSASTPVAWQDVSSSVGTGPSARTGAGMTYDAHDGYVVLFGGENGGGTSSHDDTWTFAGGTWSNITSTAGSPPPARASPLMTYDARDGVVLLFGGLAVTGGGYWLNDYADTWEFSGGHWTNITSSAGTPPSGRFSMSSTFDPTDHVVLAFGGENVAVINLIGSVTMYSDTWTFSGGLWNDITSSVGAPPSARAGSNIAYDPAAGYVLLYGGLWETLSGTVLSGREMADTWWFQSGSWTNRTGSVAGDPGELALSGIAWDGNANSVVMFGGCTPPVSQSCPVGNATWTYNGGTWTNVTSTMTVAPAPRASVAMTNDSRDGYLLLFGGSCGAGCATGDTWTENGRSPSLLTLTLSSSCGQVSFNGVVQPSGASLTVPAGKDTAALSLCSGKVFVGWNVTGGVAASPPNVLTTALTIWASGTLTAWSVDPLTVTAAASSPTVGLGASDILSGSATGGVPPVRYLWSLNGTNTTSTQNPWTLSYAHAGNYTYVLWATDAQGATARSRPTITVQVLGFTPTPLTLNLTMTSYYAPSGSSQVGTATASGGTSYTYAWYENSTPISSCPVSTSASDSCTFPFPHGGHYGISVSVSDQLGRSTPSATVVTVYTPTSSGPPPPMTAGLTSNTTSAYVGEPVMFTVAPSGGLPPYSYFVLDSSQGGNSSPYTHAQITISFSAPGSVQVKAWAYDSAGDVASSSAVTITVEPVPTGAAVATPFWASSVDGVPVLVLLILPIAVVLALFALVIHRRRGRQGPPPEGPYGGEAYAPGPATPAWPDQMAPDPYGGTGYGVPPGPPRAPGPYSRR